MTSRVHDEQDPNAPETRRAQKLKPHEKPDQLAEKAREAENRQEALIDEAVEESFPSSDPISPKRIT